MEIDQNLLTSSRKDDHILLAKKSIIDLSKNDSRFYYEPLLSTHPKDFSTLNTSFLGKAVSAPLWVSSMTGGSVNANRVNKQLAEVCRDFGLGMGLGSCRPLLESDKYFDDFNLRPILGDELPLLANIGLAQVEKLNGQKELLNGFIKNLEKLKVDGIFIHINPLQEFLQPEGDRFHFDPIISIKKFSELCPFHLFVKEVGQGMGPGSLLALSEINLSGIEFGAFGGTNFSKLELIRNEDRQNLNPLCQVGHSAEEMIEFIKKIGDSAFSKQEVIISGGITNFLDAHFLMEKLGRGCFYGMAGKILDELSSGQKALEKFIKYELEGLSFARSYLTLKEEYIR